MGWYYGMAVTCDPNVYYSQVADFRRYTQEYRRKFQAEILLIEGVRNGEWR